MFESSKSKDGVVTCTMDLRDARILSYACIQYARHLRQEGGDTAGREYAKVLSHVSRDLTCTVERKTV